MSYLINRLSRLNILINALAAARDFVMYAARSGKAAAVHSGMSVAFGPGITRVSMMRFKAVQGRQFGEMCSIKQWNYVAITKTGVAAKSRNG